ncbi:hypothetical protein [Asticcacaulis sp. EMRT-3]|uniref:hypothetical protein n=1 Tax=Asticcacaulis sp. EMRT-3 TaxID=3040349 RepID=UPI0024AF6BFA|nr:hypothetical protein [Asticcacaulis sp. EMRT-3]MDI7774112.1 hypothetical protein [Asticcacaulis sp. EMRT-3]
MKGAICCLVLMGGLALLSACATTRPELDPLPTQSIDAPPPPPPGEAPVKTTGTLPTQPIDAPPPPPPASN